MGFIDVFLIGVALSMDAFAIAVCKGLCMRKLDKKQAVIIGLFFGGFQALMPFIGWFIGKQFERYISAFDHWVAFILLSIIGGKMLYETLTENGECDTCEYKTNYKELFVLAVATSIDALAAGVSFMGFSFGKAISSVSMIGVTTFVLSTLGVAVGNKFGTIYKRKAEIAGGIVLIFIGIKILLENYGIIF